MAWQSGGGGGIPGLTSDHANGIIVAGTMQTGNPASTDPQFQQIYGNLDITALNADLQDGDPALILEQTGVLTNDQGAPALLLRRRVIRNGHKMLGPVIQFNYSGGDAVPLDEPVIQHPAFNTNEAGGLARFGHNPTPTAASSITGALSAVTDPAALDVLTAIIAALVADGGATNNTT